MQQHILKMGDKLFPALIGKWDEDPSRLKITMGYSSYKEWERLKAEIKAMQGYRPHCIERPGQKKQWFYTVADSPRNKFAIQYLDKNQPNPYDHWRLPYPVLRDLPRMSARPGEKKETLRNYQVEIASEIIHKRRMLLAAEMGAGKTLIAITVLDMIRPVETWYVAPAFALHDIKKEFLPYNVLTDKGWNCTVWPKFMSYEEVVKLAKEWNTKHKGRKAPDAIIVDESINVKNPDSQRSQYIQAIADGMRREWDNPLILLMSGAPAPKNPTDFWQQLEIIQPGFIREGNINKFKDRLALMEKGANQSGGYFPKLVTWWNDENKCKTCGQYEDVPDHENSLGVHFHRYEKSINQVDKLYNRMSGIVRVVFKKDVLPELPEKVYRTIDCDIDLATKRRARLILKGAKTTAEALTLCRELSDGIRYETIDSETQFQPCERCNGTLIMREYNPNPIDIPCDRCDHGDGPTGQQRKQISNTIYLPCGKDKALKELLEENEDNARIVIYAGFTGSINRIVAMCKKEGWETIRADGTTSNMKHRCSPSWETLGIHPLDVFQGNDERKMAFIAHPKTAKAGITLTKASMIVYYSNTFDFDDRVQSEDRIHRLGMDLNKGATIVDLIGLDTDRYVLDNLRNKRQLQAISLGELQRELLKEAA